MAPKRKRTVWQRSASMDSSFTDCPACQMKVVSYLINHHLDWDCPALIRIKEQYPIILAAEGTEKVLKNPEELSCNQATSCYSGPDNEDFDARAQDRLSVLDTEAQHQVTRNQDPVSGLHNGLHVKKPQAELRVYCDGDKLNAESEKGVNTGHAEPDSDGQRALTSDAGLSKVSSIGDVDFHDRHDIASNTNGECLEIQSGSLIQKDGVDSKAPHLLFEGHVQSSVEASTSSPKSVKGDTWRFITASLPPKAPSGHYLFENFVSEKEEQDILCFLDTDLKNPWRVSKFNGLQTGKAYGILVDLRKRCVCPAVHEMPKVLVPIVERMRTVIPVLKDFWPNETNAIDYRKQKGHWLKPHVDDRQLSGTIVVNLSFCGDCKMTYERERGLRESYKILLRRRCIQVLTGEARYNFTHSILNADLLDPRRVSMTFRQSVNA